MMVIAKIFNKDKLIPITYILEHKTPPISYWCYYYSINS